MHAQYSRALMEILYLPAACTAERVLRQTQTSKPDAARATTAGKFPLAARGGRIKETAKQGPIFSLCSPESKHTHTLFLSTHTQSLPPPPIFTPFAYEINWQSIPLDAPAQIWLARNA